MAGRAGVDSGVASLLIANENLRRELTGKESEIVRLRRLLEDKDRKIDEVIASRTAGARDHDRDRRELERVQRELAIALNDRHGLTEKYGELNAYVKKLETRVTAGGKEFLLEQNAKLSKQVSALKADLAAAREEGEKTAGELARALREIEVLVSALPPFHRRVCRVLCAPLAPIDSLRHMHPNMCSYSPWFCCRPPRWSCAPRSLRRPLWAWGAGRWRGLLRSPPPPRCCTRSRPGARTSSA